MKLLRVDMRNESTVATDLPDEWLTIGGSGLIANIMNNEVPPETAPLSPDNKLVIACGILAGTKAPQLGRISVGTKSPLTLGIKEANAGGPAGQHMDRLAKDLRVPELLSDFGIAEKDVPNLARGVMKVTRLLANNPRTMNVEEAEEIYMPAL